MFFANNVIDGVKNSLYDNVQYYLKHEHEFQIDEYLAWTKHIEFIAGKISSGIGAIKKAKEFVDRNTLVWIYNALVQPHFDYCCEV